MDRVFVVDGFISPRLSGYSVYLHIPSPPPWVAGAVLGTLYSWSLRSSLMP